MKKNSMKIMSLKIFLGVLLIVCSTSFIQCSNIENITKLRDKLMGQVKQADTNVKIENNKENEEEQNSNSEISNKDDKLKENNDKNKEMNSKEKTNIDKKYNKDLLTYTYQGYDKRFQGYLDYMHTLNCVKEEENDDGKISKYKGEISHKNGEKSNFYIIQTVNKDSIIENIECDDKNNKNLSIIPNKIALKLPINEGITWSQKINIEGKSYNVNSNINKVEKATNKSRKRIHVIYTINNIPGYKNNTYTEKCIYEESLGLVFFEKSLPENYEFKTFNFKRSDKHIGYKYTE